MRLWMVDFEEVPGAVEQVQLAVGNSAARFLPTLGWRIAARVGSAGLQPVFFLDGPCPAVPACQMRAAARAFSCEGCPSWQTTRIPSQRDIRHLPAGLVRRADSRPQS